jgi:integrase
MPKTYDGSGTLYLRGRLWWVKIRVNGRPLYYPTKCTEKADAIRFRDKLLGRKARGEISGSTVLINNLLDDVLKSDIKPSTRYVWEKVIEANIRPFFGKLKADKLTTDHMDRYREKRKTQKRRPVSDSTVNRELSILRTAFHNARKRTPPKVTTVPYFPMREETNIRQGFLTDEQYDLLMTELPDELKPLFVTGYNSGLRRGEVTAIQWPQVDFEAGLIVLEMGTTKNDDARSVPILDGDMLDLLAAAKKERDEKWPHSPWVFNRVGQRIADFRAAWDAACKRAGVPDLKFHDLRRTAVRNMRRAGVPQVIRMKIAGHKTDSMERRYNIVDGDDLRSARELMQSRRKIVTKNVTNSEFPVVSDDTAPLKKSGT